MTTKITLDTTSKKTKVTEFAEIWEDTNTGSKSLYATTSFKPGEILCDIGSKETLQEPNYLSVQIKENQHIMLNPEFLQYINHSCKPNVIFDIDEMVVKAATKIKVGEEMTFFYPSTEWSMKQNFACLCESNNCLENIKGASYLPQEILTQYSFSKYVQEKLHQKWTDIK